MKCERLPPEGWPDGPCGNRARYDVLYRLRTEKEPRGIRLCLAHINELQQLQQRGMVADWDVKEIT